MGLLVDMTPLRVSADFRRLWIGQAVSFIGSTMTIAALPYQVFHMTHSNVAVGLLGVAQLVPLLLFALVGGSLADSVDKRRLLLTLMAISLCVPTLLFVNASLPHPQLWLLYVLGAASSAGFATTFPVTRSLLPMLLPDEHRPAAFALQSTYSSLGMMVGPAIAGVLIGAFGLSTTYAVDVFSYLIALFWFARLAPSPPVGQHTKRGSVLEGIKFLWGSVVISVFAIDFIAMIFGMPRALFPALAERLGGGAGLYGLLVSSVAVGAFVASLASGWTSHVKRQGAAVLVCVAIWGLAIALAGLTTQPALVLLLLACAGGADMISGVYRGTIAAAMTPDEMRGRVGGVEYAVYAGGPVLGDVEAGVVGGVTSTGFAIVSGGLACVAGAALFAVCVPGLARYRRPEPEPAPDPQLSLGA